MKSIIPIPKSIIPACDISTIDQLERLVEQTVDIEGIGAYKVGFELALSHGLPKVVEAIRKYTNKPIIYDHQKAGTDIPDTGKAFAKVCKNSDIDAIILFPQSGPVTESSWIKTAQELGLGVIVGGEMTHARYLDGDFSNERNKDGTVKTDYSAIFHQLGMVDQTGFIRPEGVLMMYLIAAKLGVEDFVVPGNKPERIALYKSYIEEQGGIENPSFFSPGFVAQGGEVSKGAAAAGQRFHAIVGRGIYEARDMRQAAIELGRKL